MELIGLTVCLMQLSSKLLSLGRKNVWWSAGSDTLEARNYSKNINIERDESKKNVRAAWRRWDTLRHHTCRQPSTHAFLLNECQEGTFVTQGALTICSHLTAVWQSKSRQMWQMSKNNKNSWLVGESAATVDETGWLKRETEETKTT